MISGIEFTKKNKHNYHENRFIEKMET